MKIELTVYHELLLAQNAGWAMSADLGHGPPVEVLGVRVVGADGFEVLTHRGYKVAVSVSTERQVKVVEPSPQRSLFA